MTELPKQLPTIPTFEAGMSRRAMTAAIATLGAAISPSRANALDNASIPQGAPNQGVLAALAASGGAALVGFQQAGTGAVARTSEAKMRDIVSVKDFGAVGNGVANDTAAIQAALDYAETIVTVEGTFNANSGVELSVPKGVYRITATLKVPNFVWLVGAGRENTTITTVNDIVLLESKAAANISVVNIGIIGIKFLKESTNSTTYHINIINPSLTTFRDVYTFTKIDDTTANPTFFGGIRLFKDPSFSGAAIINRIHDCFIQNGGIFVSNVTDGEITDSYIYGHNVNHCLKFVGNSGNWNIAGNNLTSAQANAAVWLADPAGAFFRITGNFFDGLVADLKKGHGILSQGVQSVLVSHNHFTHQLSGIRAVQPYFWTINGNHFRNCNNKDTGATAGFWPDIEIVGLSAFNTIADNTHQQLASRSPNQAYAYKETGDGSGAPANNSYTGNAIFGVANGYAQNPNGLGSMLVAGVANKLVGNQGYNGECLADTILKGENGIEVSKTAGLGPLGTTDMVINTETYAGSPGGFVGSLYVTATNILAASQSRRAAYDVFCYGTTSTFTQRGVFHDGSGGGATFTLSTPSNGTIRFTEASSLNVGVRMTFVGTKSMA